MRGSDNERLKSPEDTTGVPGKSRWIAAIVGIGTLALCLHTAFVKEPPNYRVVVEASRNVLSGENPYGPELGLDRFKYSPLGGLLTAPFGLLPAGPGLLLFLLANARTSCADAAHRVRRNRTCPQPAGRVCARRRPAGAQDPPLDPEEAPHTMPD